MTTAHTTIESSVRSILARPYVRRLLPDPVSGFTATIQEFPGCIAEGASADEALANLDAAAAAWIEIALEQGLEIREPISFDGCSGKIALRIPRGLHRQAAELAELEGCSVNQLLATAIAVYVGTRCCAPTSAALKTSLLDS